MRAWLARYRVGTGLIVTIVTSLVLCSALAGLHYYERVRLERAARIVRDLGRAGEDLSVGFLHVALSGTEPRAWQREQGLALVLQSLRDFERATGEVRVGQDDGKLRAFRANVQHFRALLQAHRGERAELGDLEVRLALHGLMTGADEVDALLRADLRSLRQELDRAFLATLAGAVLLLGCVCWVLYRAERERLTTSHLLQAISQGSTDAIFAKDSQGRYLFVNRAGSRLLGKEPELVVGRKDRELFSVEEALAIERNDRRILQDAATRTYEELISTVAGPMTLLATKGPLLDARGNVVGMFGISRDITDRKRGEALLQESRAKLENVIESLHEGLIIWDVETGEVHWNRAALLMHGFDGKSQPNMTVSMLQSSFQLTTLDGQEVRFYDWPLNRVLRGESLSGLLLQVRRPELHLERVFSFDGSLARRDDDQPMFALLSINDVTMSRRAEESARHAQRLEALGTLSAGVAHDFNNILFAITGNVQLARLEVPESSPALEFLDEIGKASARAADLVRRILLFARSQESRRSAVELWPVVEDALKLLRPTLPAQIQITTSVSEPGAVVRADTSQIHQVITNLVTNAAHAVLRAERLAPRQVRIVLESIELTQELPCHGRSLPPGRYARLTVEDDGCGMDEATARRAFDPFFTTKPTGEGTGLGLSIVHGIVSNHEGAVGIDSELGRGTRVHVYLPIAADAVVRVSAQGASATRSKVRVLFIDDEQALVRVAERGLGKLGHRVTGFVNAEQGLQAFERDPDGFDVVVTDLSMPELSGFDVAEAVASRRPGLPVLMMSGFVRPEDRDRARRVGIRELLGKPSSVEQLAAAIDRCCAPALLENAQRAPGHASGGA